jgi:hypothetical protein
MGVYKIFPSQDTTIYTDYNNLNAGLDSILDLSKNSPTLYASSSTSRILIKFDNTDLANAISKSGPNFTASLKLYSANIDGIPTNFNIEVHPIYESWDMGTGRFNNVPETEDGASWRYRNANRTNLWSINSLPSNVTSSYYGDNPGGASWYTASSTQSFNYFSTKDINVNVTQFINWYASSIIPNNGFIIMNSTSASVTGTGSFEFDHNYNYTFNFFSRDTNTIYPPYLEIKWNDSIFNSGSTLYVPNEEINIAISNNKNIFYDNEYVKFRVYAREKYPPRVYAEQSLYIYNKLLPTSSYYSIIDLQSNLTVVNFDSSTQLSNDTTSSYFRMYMNGLEPDRYYKIQIKSIIDGGTYIYDDDYYFKINQTVL